MTRISLGILGPAQLRESVGFFGMIDVAVDFPLSIFVVSGTIVDAMTDDGTTVEEIEGSGDKPGGSRF